MSFAPGEMPMQFHTDGSLMLPGKPTSDGSWTQIRTNDIGDVAMPGGPNTVGDWMLAMRFTPDGSLIPSVDDGSFDRIRPTLEAMSGLMSSIDGGPRYTRQEVREMSLRLRELDKELETHDGAETLTSLQLQRDIELRTIYYGNRMDINPVQYDPASHIAQRQEGESVRDYNLRLIELYEDGEAYEEEIDQFGTTNALKYPGYIETALKWQDRIAAHLARTTQPGVDTTATSDNDSNQPEPGVSVFGPAPEHIDLL